MHAQTAKLLFLVALASALGACSVYRPEIRQGNYIEPLKIAQVKPGMTREQVRFLLGPPMVADGFHRSQWDYYFTLEAQFIKPGQVKRHFIVRFDGDLVTSIDEPGRPAADPSAPKADTRVEKLFEEPATTTPAKPADAPVEKPVEAPVPPPAEAPAAQG